MTQLDVCGIVISRMLTFYAVFFFFYLASFVELLITVINITTTIHQ